jgi:hypothetical protein
MPKVATEQQFGIVGEHFGLREDIPSIRLSKAYSPESKNIVVQHGEIKRVPGRWPGLRDTDGNRVQTPDGYPIIHYHLFRRNTSGLEYVLAFTKAHIYMWKQDTGAFQTKFTCGDTLTPAIATDCERWESITFNDEVWATNNVDKVVKWNGGNSIDNTFEVVGDATYGILVHSSPANAYLEKAKHITAYENYIILGSVTVKSTTYPDQLNWCAYGDGDHWDADDTDYDAGSKSFYGDMGFFMGFGFYQGDLILAFQYSMYRMWLVITSEVFNTDELYHDVGSLSADAMVNDRKGRFYWLASDYTYRELTNPDPISMAVDKSLRDLNPQLVEYAQATFIEEYGTIYLAVPLGPSSTGNNWILDYDPRPLGGRWGKHEIPVRAFGRYRQQDFYAWNSTPPGDSDTWTGGRDIPWITTVDFPDWPIDLVSDYSGYSWEAHSASSDAGSELTGEFVLATDLAKKPALGTYKRVWAIRLFFKKLSGGTISVYSKNEHAAGWTTLGSVSLSGDDDIVEPEIYCDLRAKHLQIKIAGTGLWQLLGMIFEFAYDGDR